MAEIRIAQVGCGHWGKNLTRNFAQIGALGAIVDPHAPTAEKMSAEFGVPARTLDQVLADPAIQGVAFATPAETHAAGAIAALQAGKHVYVEKPLALTMADCRAMIDTARDTGRILMVGHLLQYHPIFAALRDLVGAGDIGTLRYVYSNRLSLGKFRTEEDVLWSFAPHDISMLLALANSPVSHVSAQGAAFVTPNIADMATVQIGFENGLRGHVFTSWCHPFKEQRLVAVGDAGMAVFDDTLPDWGQKLAIYRHRIDTAGPVPVPHKAEAEFIDVPQGEPLRTECEHFVAAIRDGRQPRTDGAEGLAVVEVLERASAAMSAG
ncbi:Gfo/Idh/MocA family protein [Paracoccus zhejiangensis]|uniref:Oxidoreductase n=1 Tax=Paracoccus zhejiangensis TaxID=1077935 RepID=A0A2H5F663_9RHOB|nr:Gfo/Idh/MocA family oxidoreductase [Paracoccus zhejiangensis]AUH67033.1 oxidoreductase [Paracoccus zhejiangensis]